MRDLAPQATADIEAIAVRLHRPTDIDQAVHATRTGIKRLRAFLRLARSSIGKSTYRVENRSLRAAARLIAPARDARVLIDTATAEHAAPSVVAELNRTHAAAIEHLEAGLRAETVRLLEAIADRWKDLAWNGPPRSAIRAGLGATYLRTRADHAAVVAEPTDASFHSWRRRVKYGRYQLEAIEAPSRFVTPYTALGDELGLEHDHTVLIGVCSSYPDDAAFADLAGRSIARRAELRSAALSVGDPLFALRPDAFVDMLDEAVDLR